MLGWVSTDGPSTASQLLFGKKINEILMKKLRNSSFSVFFFKKTTSLQRGVYGGLHQKPCGYPPLPHQFYLKNLKKNWCQSFEVILFLFFTAFRWTFFFVILIEGFNKKIGLWSRDVTGFLPSFSAFTGFYLVFICDFTEFSRTSTRIQSDLVKSALIE